MSPKKSIRLQNARLGEGNSGETGDVNPHDVDRFRTHAFRVVNHQQTVRPHQRQEHNHSSVLREHPADSSATEC